MAHDAVWPKTESQSPTDMVYRLGRRAERRFIQLCTKQNMVHCDLCIKSLQKEAMKIGRAVVEYCDEGQSVKNFISLGGPHTIFFTNAMS
jgi:hypothetical protein